MSSRPKLGSLCTGYGGLDMGVAEVFGGSMAWVSDIDKGANKILAHRYPEAPNLGDFTKLDWAAVEPVDIICAGFPCQPVSGAGKGLGDQDERWLWDEVHRAIREVRPGVVVLENVRGLVSKFGGRLFARVLGSLADIGYDTELARPQGFGRRRAARPLAHLHRCYRRRASRTRWVVTRGGAAIGRTSCS